MSLLRLVFTSIVRLQKAHVEGGHRSRRVEVPQKTGRASPCVAARDAVVPMCLRLQALYWLSSTRPVSYGEQR